MNSLQRRTELVSPGLLGTALAALIISGCGGSSKPSAPYSISVLRPLPGDVVFSPVAINSLGHVAGISSNGQSGPPIPAVVYKSAASIGTGNADAGALVIDGTTEVVGPTGVTTTVSAVSDQDVVAGMTGQFSPIPSNNHSVAFLWQSGVVTTLPLLAPGGNQLSGANAENDSGQVVGYSNLTAVVWQNGSVTALPGGKSASGINASGTVIGQGLSSNAVEWTNGVMSTLPPLSGYTTATPVAINDGGQVVGFCEGGPSGTSACLWQNGIVSELPSLGGANTQCIPYGINNKGVAVGDSGVRAVMWVNGKVIDLNTFVPSGSTWVLTGATAINDKGQITGVGNNGAFLLTPNS